METRRSLVILLICGMLICMTVSAQEDYYSLLGLKRGATDEQIKKGFKKQAIKYHPDKNKDDPETAKKRF